MIYICFARKRGFSHDDDDDELLPEKVSQEFQELLFDGSLDRGRCL